MLTEHEEQALLIDWCRENPFKLGELDSIFAIPNGLRVSPKQAKKAKREGLTKGIPDLFLPVMRSGYGGLFIEMKRTKGSHTSPEQKRCHKRLFEQGYKVVVCNGFPHARLAILAYYGVVNGPE